jgi:iron(III) transport system ATP-binding protein
LPSILSLDEPRATPNAVAIAPGRAPSAGPAATPALVVEHLGRRYGSAVALDDVSFEVAPGEMLCVLGASGSGKSTLLRLVAGVERPSSGRIELRGVEVAGPAGCVDAEARRIGMVFQDYALFPHLTVAANVAFGLKGQPAAQVRQRVGAMLERVDLARHAGSYPHMLSGGERQRVALARALAPRPQLLLMDEPFSSLDGPLRETVRQHTIGLLRDTGTTTLVVTHDPEEALRIADRIALLDRGRLVQCATPEALYRHPAAPCAARVFGPVNELRAVCRAGTVETPLGRFSAPGVAGRAAARVFIRPHALRTGGHPGSTAARVVRTTFLGNTRHVHLEIPGLAEPLLARVDGPERFDRDAIVFVDVDDRDVIVLEDT